MSLLRMLLSKNARRTTLLATIVALLIPATAGADTRRIGPGTSFASAYNAAKAGDVIEVGPGVYGPQEVPAGTKAVTFRGLPGNKIRQLQNSAAHITFEGLDVDAGGGTPNGAVWENHGDTAHHVTFRNGRVGNTTDQKGALLGGWSSTASQHVVIDNVEFHDVIQQGPEVHNECIFSQSPGVTIRNSTFRNCATMDLFLVRGDWWGQPPYGGVTLENNVFGHSVNGDGWHYYGLYYATGSFRDVRVVNNSFENSVILDPNNISGPTSGVWANNIGGGWDCLSGVTFRNNVGKRCHSSDKAVSPQSSCAPPACGDRRTMPVGWINPAALDLRLSPSSPAVDAGTPAYAPATDKLGKRRDSRPDAGAYEQGAGGTAGAAPSAGWRMQRVALRPRVICHRARRGCPSSTKLRFALGKPARVAIRVQRVRKGHKPRRVRSIKLRAVKLHKARRIRAAGLKKGRYRVVVWATDGVGARSAPARLKLRVR